MHRGRYFILGLVLVGAAAGLARARPDVRAVGAAGRLDEAIVLSGAQLAPFTGAPGDQLWVYVREQGDWQFVAGQLDDRDDTGQYVASDGTGLDANDDYVFMADALGQPMLAGAWPPNLGREHPAIEVKVTDPLQPDWAGYAYLFWSGAAPYPRVKPPVRFDAATGELSSDHYVLGFPDPAVDKDGYVGLKRLSLGGGTRNLLDRLKIRIDVTFLGTRSTLTEQELAAFAGDQFRVAPVKLGPLRAVLDPTGANMAYGRRVSLFGGLDQLGGIQPPVGQLELHGLRVSLDLASALGEVTYADANIPIGVPVDGLADTVPTAPLPDWRQLTFTEGRAVILRSHPGQPSAATVYYKDDKAQDSADTGDYRSFGDAGAQATTLDDWASAGFPGEMVVLDQDDPRTAAQLVEQKAHPLVVTVTVGELPDTATPGPATRTPEPTATAPLRHAYLPWSHD
jgi:hypothetical protein